MHEHNHNHASCHEHCSCHAHEQEEGKGVLLRLAVGGILLAIGLCLRAFTNLPAPLTLAILIAAYALLGYDVVLRALSNLVRGRVFDEHFLMTLSTLGAFAIGEYPEAVAVMLFYQLGEYFQDRAVDRSRNSISALLDIRPDSATVERDGALCAVAADEVAVGETVVVRAGERIPTDGVVLSGEASLDTAALTGESVPRHVGVGDEVRSGCINQDGVLFVRVTRVAGESTAAKILTLVESAAEKKAHAEHFITAFARYYTPIVVALAVLLAVVPSLIFGGFSAWLHRALVFLVISCPCALVLSIPLTFFGGIGAASRHGVLVKGGNYLEALCAVKTVVFDKTGTLTRGVFAVSALYPADTVSKDTLLFVAAHAECLSNHPIAKSILCAYGAEPDRARLCDYVEYAGRGVSVTLAGEVLLAGNAALMEASGIAFWVCDAVGTKVYVARAGQYLGCIVIADTLKTDSGAALTELRRMGIEKTVLLTGDDAQIAAHVAKELGIDEWHAQLLPADKVAHLEALAHTRGKVAFVGDGTNDAPVLARADVGIAMGGLGSDAAIEAADVVLMTDEPSALVSALRIARATRRIVWQNIVLALGIKIAFLALGALGLVGMWEAVFADVGVALLAVCNAMRILKK